MCVKKIYRYFTSDSVFKTGSLKLRTLYAVCSSVNRLLVEEKDRTKGWTKMAEDWDRPVCSSVNRLLVEEKDETKGWTRMAEDWDRPVCSSVNRLLVEEKDKTKGLTKMAQDWDRPVCSAAFSLTVFAHSESEHRFPAPSLREGCRKPVLGVCVWCSNAVAASCQNHYTSGFLRRFYI